MQYRLVDMLDNILLFVFEVETYEMTTLRMLIEWIRTVFLSCSINTEILVRSYIEVQQLTHSKVHPFISLSVEAEGQM